MTTGDKNGELGGLLEKFDIHVLACLFWFLGGREDREGVD